MNCCHLNMYVSDHNIPFSFQRIRFEMYIPVVVATALSFVFESLRVMAINTYNG